MSRKWKKQEKETLRQQLGNGVLLQGVEISGRNYDGIRRQARKLSLIPRLSGVPWTFEQQQKLIELRRQGIAPKKIADLNLLGPPLRTAGAISKACTKLGLAGKNRSLACKNRKVWQGEEKQEFIAFLLQHSAELAPEQIAEKFGVKKVTVECWQRQLGIKLCLQETLALPHIKSKMQRVYRQKSQKILAKFEQGLAKKQEELMALAQKTRNRKRVLPLEEKQCAVCGQFWPRHKRFFYYSSKRTNRFTYWYFFTHCKICTSKQRHAKNAQRRRKKYHG